MKLNETERFPLNDEKIKSRDPNELYLYLKSLIKKLNDVYSKIASSVNVLYDSSGGETPSNTVTPETSYGQVPSPGSATSYSRGDHTHGTPEHTKAVHDALGINADTVDGFHHDQSLKTTDSPSFSTVKLTNLTDNKVPYHRSDTDGLVDSSIQTDGTNVGMGRAPINHRLVVAKSDAEILAVLRESNLSGQGAGIQMMALDSNGAPAPYGGFSGFIDTNTAGSQSGYVRFYVVNNGVLYEVLECQKTGFLKVYAVSGHPTIGLYSRDAGYETLQLRYKYNEDGAGKHRIGFTDGGGNWLAYSEYGTGDLYVKGRIQGFQKARAYRSSAQSIPHNSLTKVRINTISFDPDGIVDITKNRIKPTKAGYYIVTGQISIDYNPGYQILMVSLLKNGTEVARGNRQHFDYFKMGSQVVTDLIYFNGSTDYVELYVYQYHSSGSAQPLEIASYNNYLSVVGPF